MSPRVTPELQLEIERFLFEEAALLDRHEYRDWLSLFAEDLVYQMPVTTNYHEQAIGAPPPPGPQAYYFHDDLRTLTQRVKRLETGKGWAEMPPSRTRRMISNVMLTPADVAGEWDVASNFLLYRSRLERQVDLFVGCRVDRLRPHPDGSRWKIARRDLTLDQGTLLANNLSIFFLMSQRIHACGVQELADGEMRVVADAPFALAVCRVKDEWFAFENNCTHEDFPLTEGAVDGVEIECALHGARFCLRTGEIRAVPASCPIRVFPVHVDGDAVQVELP